ncbi:hypothetical protein Pint_17451 [Pistacia integerrima]|uniref:Uncharacterized protein n=1 Tax=Pistacia integerrima TaxID=434235 RepID=A0ACC0Z046_9ROSI|nr:hypothetical protein Pint_17451 [Pistacia integerrima]
MALMMESECTEGMQFGGSSRIINGHDGGELRRNESNFRMSEILLKLLGRKVVSAEFEHHFSILIKI